MKYTPDFSSRFRILKGGKISLVVSALVAGSTMSFASPTGAQVTSGSASIAQNGSITTINQSTNKASINWNSFSIAPSETVNFVQPSAQSVTLNRVVGATSSLIQGAMNANGQVFLLNPNGVLFANGSQINVGGLVASTLNITDANFQAGKYIFEGNSQNSIINMGSITTAQGGYVAMMGKHVANEGTIVATMGNVQMASGEKISLNLNGNSLVKLTIDKGTLNALVENKGLIQADGGQVYLTTQALNTILDGMVNNTGVIEAQTLNNVTGKVVLYAHGGTANISGTVDARGGFVETSGTKLGVKDGTVIKAKTWLLDPVNVTIDSSSDAIGGETVGASVVSAALTNGTSVTIEADQNVKVFESIITGNMANDATLTLKAGYDVVIGQYQSGTPVLIDATQNGNDNKLNVYISVSNAEDSHRFEMTGVSSIKTNGGNVVVGGAITNGAPNTDGTAAYSHGASIYESSTIDAGAGDITIAAKGSGSQISVQKSMLRGKDITLNAHDAGLSLQGATLQATGNAVLSGNTVNMESVDLYDENDNWISTKDTEIGANRIEVTAGDSLDIRDAVIKVNDRATFSATNSEVNLEGTQILFASTGTLEVNAYSAGVKQDRIDSLLSSWRASDANELLALINDDEGASYISMDQYFANSMIGKPLFVDLKGGSYVSKVFSDGTPNTINATTLPILNNGLLAFGNGLEGSVGEFGMLKQPLYYDQSAGRWYKLTYSNYPLAAIIGAGGDGTGEWNLNGTVVSTIEDGSSAFSNVVLNTSGLTNGHGSIAATNTVTIDGQTMEMTNTYTLSSDKALIAIDTKLKNTSGSPMENVRLWVGAKDDWIGQSDDTTKERGNLVNGSFQAIADSTERAKALMITGDTSGVLFRTTSAKSNVFSKEEFGSDFYTQDPATSSVHIDASDGAYGVFTRFSDLANSGSEAIRWYYGAGSLGSLADLATAVSQQPSSSVPAPIPAPTPTQPAVQVQVNNVVTTIVNSTTVTPPAPIVVAPVVPQQQVQTQVQNNVLLQSILPQGTGTSGSFGLVGTTDGTSAIQTVSMEQLQGAATTQGMGEIRVPLANNSLVELVNGGLNLPTGVTQEFYVVDNSANTGRAQSMSQEDQDKKTKKN